MAIRIQIRRDTAANWTSANPVLRAGEFGVETDTLKFKIGNGSSTWTQISTYANVTPTGLSNSLGDYILLEDQGTPGGPAELNASGDLLVPENSIILWDDNAYTYQTTLSATQPTANRTITLPNATGTVALTSDIAELSQDAIDTALTAGTGITKNYNDSTNTLTIAVDTTAIQAKVTDVSDTEIGYLNGVTSAIQTQLDDKSTASKTETLTNKSISLGSNTVTSTLAQLNTAVTDADLATLAGTETLTNKTLTSPAINTPTGITKSDVGLANVDNTTDANKPVSTATQTALDLKAPLASPTFTGTVNAAALTLSGDLTVNGTTTTINSTTLSVDDKNVVLGDVATPSDATADGGGITLKGATDKTFNWVDATDSWTSSEHVNLASGKSLYLNGTLLKDTAETLTNKTINATSNTITVASSNVSDFNEAAQDAIGNAVGTGLSYNDTTGSVSVTTNTYDAYGSASTVAGNLSTHESDTTTHGTTGNIVGTSDTQTLTNKTLTSPVINTPTGITKSDVGLANVDNTTDANKPVSTATQTALDLKAPLASPTFTGTVSGVTATHVGLSNVDNTSDANKPVSTATQTALDLKLASATAATTYETITNVALKAPLASPALTGTPTAPTAAAGNNSTQVATTAYADAAVAALVDAAPGTLNTLNEIAAAINDDASYAATITTALGEKAPLASPTFTGTVSGVTKTHVGLGNVDNTTDANKPVSTATQTALNLKLNLTDPAIDYYVTNSGSGAYLVNGVSNGNIYFEKGKKYRIHVSAEGHPFWIQTVSGGYSSGNVYSTGITNNGTEDGQIIVQLPSNAPQLYYACQYHSSMAGSVVTGTTFETYKALSNLSNVDNTTDANKPVSTATQTALDLKAPLASPTFTGTVSGVTKTHVGLGNVDNTTDANKPVSTATQTALDLKAPLASPTFTGTVSGVTATHVGLGNVDNTSDANKPVSTATQTALDLKIDESLFDAKGDLIVGSADNTPAKLSAGTNGYVLTANSSATNGIEWAASAGGLPSQTGSSGYYLSTNGSTASWVEIVLPAAGAAVVSTTVSSNSITTIDTIALSSFTSAEYLVSLKQGSKIRTSKVIIQEDGTNVDMTEFAITETGGTISGVVVSATASSPNALLQLTATDAATTNVSVKLSKVLL